MILCQVEMADITWFEETQDVAAGYSIKLWQRVAGRRRRGGINIVLATNPIPNMQEQQSSDFTRSIVLLDLRGSLLNTQYASRGSSSSIKLGVWFHNCIICTYLASRKPSRRYCSHHAVRRNRLLVNCISLLRTHVGLGRRIFNWLKSSRLITWANQQVVHHKLPRSHALHLCPSLCQDRHLKA